MVGFKKYIWGLNLADSTKRNYCKYVDWIEESVPFNISKQNTIDELFIESVAQAFRPNIKWVNDARRSDVRSIMRHYRAYRGATPYELVDDAPDDLDEGDKQRSYMLRLVDARRGQPEFRKLLLRQYRNTCAITGCMVLDVLEAAHVDPYHCNSSSDLTNGLLLRADIHILFDLGLIIVNPHDEVSECAPSLRGVSLYKKYHKIKLSVQLSPKVVPNLSQHYMQHKKRWTCVASG